MNIFDALPEDLSLYELFKQSARKYPLLDLCKLQFNSEKTFLLKHKFTGVEGQYTVRLKIQHVDICVYSYNIDVQVTSNKHSVEVTWTSSTLYDITHFADMVEKMHKQLQNTISNSSHKLQIAEAEVGMYMPKSL